MNEYAENSGSKASKRVAIGAVAALAIAVTAYACSQAGKEETAYCVMSDSLDSDEVSYESEESFEVVDDSNCDDDDDYYSSSHGSYYWYYGGHLNAGRVTGGSTVKPSGSTIKSRSGSVIERGGFGGRYGGGG